MFDFSYKFDIWIRFNFIDKDIFTNKNDLKSSLLYLVLLQGLRNIKGSFPCDPSTDIILNLFFVITNILNVFVSFHYK